MNTKIPPWLKDFNTELLLDRVPPEFYRGGQDSDHEYVHKM